MAESGYFRSSLPFFVKTRPHTAAVSMERYMLRTSFLVAAAGLFLVACKPGPKAPDAKNDKPVQLKVAPEDLLTVQTSGLTSGPVVTGSVQPERKADLRAEVSAVVLQVLKENGDAVKRGDALVRLDETAIRDAVNSAEASLANARQALDQAQRQVTRQKTLRDSGMTSAQALDDAEVRRNAAQSEVSAAQTRVAQARQQLSRTVVRAPFDGVVSERKVSAGDTASPGKELLKVIDPSSMRFEGRVPADRIGLVKAGQPVSFRINGYGNQEFRGVIRRVDPLANEVTRQVEVLVDFTPKGQHPKVAGLYGEGRVEAETTNTLMLPEQSLVKAGDNAYAWQVKGNALKKANLKLGVRDPRSGHYEVKAGLAAGDQVLRTPSSSFKDGQSVQLAPARMAAAPVAAGK
jgi:RND family efflux transporter MFP subunit